MAARFVPCCPHAHRPQHRPYPRVPCTWRQAHLRRPKSGVLGAFRRVGRGGFAWRGFHRFDPRGAWRGAGRSAARGKGRSVRARVWGAVCALAACACVPCLFVCRAVCVRGCAVRARSCSWLLPFPCLLVLCSCVYVRVDRRSILCSFQYLFRIYSIILNIYHSALGCIQDALIRRQYYIH